MDIEQITQLVNGVGFPIVASGALFWLNVKIINRIDRAMRDNTDAIRELHKTIGSNTHV